MPRDLNQLIDALNAEKRLIALSEWTPATRKDEISAALEIEGVTEQGITFRGRCEPSKRDERVAFMLFTETAKKPRAFARIDWRGTEHPNENKLFAGAMWGDSAGRTHFHDPRLHLHIDYDTLFYNKYVDLPVAREISPEPTSFRQLCQISGMLLNITNLDMIPEPPWPQTASFL